MRIFSILLTNSFALVSTLARQLALLLACLCVCATIVSSVILYRIQPVALTASGGKEVISFLHELQRPGGCLWYPIHVSYADFLVCQSERDAELLAFKTSEVKLAELKLKQLQEGMLNSPVVLPLPSSQYVPSAVSDANGNESFSFFITFFVFISFIAFGVYSIWKKHFRKTYASK